MGELFLLRVPQSGPCDTANALAGVDSSHRVCEGVAGNF